MARAFTSHLAAGLAVVALAAAGSLRCTSSDPSAAEIHPYDAKGATCIDYPDVGYRVFPYEASPPAGPFPQCTPACHPRYADATAGLGTAPLDQDLPAGACDDDGATCDSPLMAGSCSPCVGVGGPGNGYQCTCRDHRWQCVLTAQGGNVCDPPACLELPADPEAGLCRYAQRFGDEICGCETCRKLCESDADCDTGTCHVGQVCFRPDQCPSSGDCLAICTGFCL